MKRRGTGRMRTRRYIDTSLVDSIKVSPGSPLVRPQESLVRSKQGHKSSQPKDSPAKRVEQVGNKTKFVKKQKIRCRCRTSAPVTARG